jgi:hypothetical protein
MHFIVTRKSDGIEVLRYSASVAQEVNGFDLIDFDHTEYAPDVPAPQPRKIVLDRLDYLRLFTAAERIAVRTAALQSPVLADYLHMLELATVVHLDHPDTIAAVNMLEQAGLLAAGRADEVLNG